MILRGFGVSVTDGQTDGWTFAILESLSRLKIELVYMQLFLFTCKLVDIQSNVFEIFCDLAIDAIENE